MEVLVVLLVALLIIAVIAIIMLVARLAQRDAFWGERLRAAVDEARGQAVLQSRATLGGRFTEQLAPYLPGFRYDPTEARFLGTPVDLIVFKGLAVRRPEEVVFLEIKSGKRPRLSESERQIKGLIEAGRVRWETLEIPEVLNDGPEATG